MRRIGALLFGVLLFPLIAVAAIAASCGSPSDMHDGWPVATPDQEGLDPVLICAFGASPEKLEGADPNGVVVVRHGKLVYERYFVGDIEYGADRLHQVKSITKSVVALLPGITQ